MRLCLFTPNFLPMVGGTERMVDILARGLLGRGHQVMVLHQQAKQGPPPPLPYPVRSYRRPPLQHLWPEALSWAVARAHRAWPFDVMLAVYAYPAGYAAGRIKHKLGFGLVVNAHGGDLYPNFHALRKPRVLDTIRKGYRRADRIIAVSQYLEGRLREVVGPDLPPIQVTYNGIDLAEMAAHSKAARENPPHLPLAKPFILHLARVAPVKQQLLALEGIHRIRDELSRRSITYAFVGDGNAMADLRRRVDELQLQPRVAILGTRVGAEKAWLLDNALFMATTSREEGMPLTVLEALASGLPVLASDIGPHRELIQPQWGRLFRNGDAADLADQLTAMLNLDLEPLRVNARNRGQHFSLEVMFDAYERACRLTRPDIP